MIKEAINKNRGKLLIGLDKSEIAGISWMEDFV
jgi:hypothetical protein